MFVFEEWENKAGSRIKSAVILIMGLALILCTDRTNHMAADMANGIMETEGDRYLTEEKTGLGQNTEQSIDLEAWLGKEAETADRQRLTQAWLDNCELEFADVMEEVAAADKWSAQYVQAAQESYLCFAEAMGWVQAYFLKETEKENRDLLTEKAYCKARLIYRETQELRQLLELGVGK